MFLLYADESGTPGGADQEYFILAGITVFERKAHWLSLELDKIASRFHPQNPSLIELHGAPMLAGRKSWRKEPKENRLQAIKDALALIISPQDPVHFTFQQLVTRFDHYLARQHTHFKNTQRGLVLFDKSSKEAPIQALAAEFKNNGHEWGKESRCSCIY